MDSLNDDSVRGDYGGPIPGVVRPMLEWETRYTPNERQMSSSSKAQHQFRPAIILLSAIMNSTPLVSVGLPTYNRASTLRRAVESIGGPGLSKPELIIGDNASTDDTERVLCSILCPGTAAYAIFRHASNLGANANFRHVLSEARASTSCRLATMTGLIPAI